MPGPPPGTGRNAIRHGTRGGYSAHYRRGIPPCDACRQAQAEYQRERYRRLQSEAGRHIAERIPTVVTLACDCGEPFTTVAALMRQTLFHHRRPPTRAERTPRAAA